MTMFKWMGFHIQEYITAQIELAGLKKKMRIKLDGQERRASGRSCGREDMNKTHYVKISKN